MNYNFQQVSNLAFEAKNKVKNGTKNLPFEEAFLTHHIFFPQLVVFSRETSILLRKELAISIKLPPLYSYESVHKAKQLDSCGKIGVFVKKLQKNRTL